MKNFLTVQFEVYSKLARPQILFHPLVFGVEDGEPYLPPASDGRKALALSLLNRMRGKILLLL